MSEAPAAPVRAKQIVAAKQLTKEQEEKEYLDNLFKSKQAEVDSDEDIRRVQKRDDLEDDDW